ncbi:nucleotidyltransferase [Striga asiatica]|uniref:Nucleotidyltransferase n=1 Tax=Striga asiatica TaxID=4170 RepID=A0A5A7QLV6_STRAF|nr:nucleotidyltransferase [Striga asiatica]
MGENEEWAESGGPLPNGLVPGSGPVLEDHLDSERWSRAEDKITELIACIQPNQVSEERRNAVADYVQRLIMKCFPCQVCTFGSVPLKTYLPDGDIDLTVFSHDQNLKDSWANQVRDMLHNEEKNENAEFRVKEVQYIQAEVKIIKCLVENIVVDISFNQVGGLCTLCFLDEVDHLINQDHLFKRSIILIKAWCYYESRVLGAHHGLISTYALETLVLYIFHVFNSSFHGPLEVLYRFLEFFSNFDWENFCVSLWGPVPISSLPNVTAEPPRKDSGELLLSKLFLDACSSVYAVFPGGQENNGQQFVSKHFNVIDPLCVNNNLGRSVSKGNFFRIRSAFAFGAKRLARLLDCPEENLFFEVNQFFTNTWDRHGSGHRPDTPGIDSIHEFSNSGNISSKNNVNQNKTPSLYSTEDRGTHGIPSHHGKNSASRMKNLKSQTLNSSRASDQIRTDNTSDWVMVDDETQESSKANRGANDIHGRFLARTSSSPELTVAYGDLSSQTGHNRKSETINTQIPSKQSLDLHANAPGEEEQEIVNMMASASLQGLNGQFQVPFNLNSGHHLPFSIPPSFLASMGYAQPNLPGFFPANNVPLMDPSLSNLQFPSNFLSPHYFSGVGVTSPSETPVEHLDSDDFWNEQNVGPENGKPETHASDDKRPASVSGLKYIPPHRLNSSERENSEFLSIKDDSNSEIYAEERSVTLRFSSAIHNNSLRSMASSENSGDESSSAKTPKSMKEKRGKKIILSSAELASGQTGIENEDAEALERNSWNISSGFEVAQASGGSDSTIPFSPMLIGPGGSRQRMNDNSGMVTFYPTGPPIPFLTMLPVYNIPPEASTSDSSSGHFRADEASENSDSAHNSETSGKKKPDILNSDFASHWQNLQFGRFCQNSRHNGGQFGYPSPFMVLPAYLQGGRFPYDSSGRPFSTNTNLFSQLMTSHGQRLLPVAPLQSVSSRPIFYQNYIDGMPRYRSGTGTYLPNPIPNRERHSSGTRRGNHNNYDRNDNYGDKEGNWNSNPKSRGSIRNHGRNQTDKSNSRTDRLTSAENLADRSWNSSYRHETLPYQSQNGQSSSSFSQNGPQIVPYNMNSLSATNPNGVSNRPSGPPFMMLYPFDHNNAVYGEQLEFGSVGHLDLPGIDEQLQVNEGTRARLFQDHRLHDGSDHYSSPDQPASPHHQRG